MVECSWLWIRMLLLSLKLQIWCLLRARSSLTLKQTKDSKFTLKRVRDMIITYSQMRRTGKYSQHSSIIWSVWLNGWVFAYELSGCGFESSCSHCSFLICRFKYILKWMGVVIINYHKLMLDHVWEYISESDSRTRTKYPCQRE